MARDRLEADRRRAGVRRGTGGARITTAQLRRRLDFLAERLGLDRERIRLWGLAKHLAWGTDGLYFPGEVEVVRMFSEVGSS